jgi:hypothetical protein
MKIVFAFDMKYEIYEIDLSENSRCLPPGPLYNFCRHGEP